MEPVRTRKRLHPALLGLVALAFGARLVMSTLDMQTATWLPPTHASAVAAAVSSSQTTTGEAPSAHHSRQATPRSATAPYALTPVSSHAAEQDFETGNPDPGHTWVATDPGPPYQARGP